MSHKPFERRMHAALGRLVRNLRVPDSGNIHVHLTWLVQREPPLLLTGDLHTNAFSGDESYSYKFHSPKEDKS